MIVQFFHYRLDFGYILNSLTYTIYSIAFDTYSGLNSFVYTLQSTFHIIIRYILSTGVGCSLVTNQYRYQLHFLII